MTADPSRTTGPEASSRQILDRAQHGDPRALDALFARHLPGLLRWSHGLLPRWARAFTDTADLVQDAFLRTFRRLDTFEHRTEGALQAYLRQAVRNRIRDELRRFNRHPKGEPLDSGHEDVRPSPLDRAITAEERARYCGGLERLDEDERELVVSRLELGYSYEQIALMSGRATPDAARMAVRRAIDKLAAEMARA